MVFPKRPIPDRIVQPRRKKPMTFVLGIQCRSGSLVLCTDSLECNGFDKQIVKKLEHYSRDGKWGVAWGCAGDGELINKFSRALYDLLGKEEDLADQLRLEELVETTAVTMKESYQEELSLVAAFWRKSDLTTKLCKLTKKCLSPEAKYACVGMDLSLARFALDSVYNDSLNIGAGIMTGVFVTHLMKERADCVGGPIQMVSYRPPQSEWKVYDQDYTANVESKFDTTEVAYLLHQYWAKKVSAWLPPVEKS
jgi:hypothetical protein